MILYPWGTLRKKGRVYGGMIKNSKLGTNDLHKSFIVDKFNLPSSALALRGFKLFTLAIKHASYIICFKASYFYFTALSKKQAVIWCDPAI